MPAQHQEEYCHVDTKTGEILEGPKALPQDWGSVSGFWHLRGKDLAKHNWYPVRRDGVVPAGSEYKAVYLPEHQLVIKLPLGQAGALGSSQYAIVQLYQMFGFFTKRPFHSEILGEVYLFPNTEHEQRHRQNCLLVKEDYVCMAETLDRKKVRVVVPHNQIKVLIKGAVNSYNNHLERLFVGLEDIQNSTDKELVAILDTNLADYYG